MNETPTLTDFTIPVRNTQPEYVTTPIHVFGLTEIFIVTGIFIVLAYLYIMVTNERVRFEKWINPNGHEVNLYKIIRRVFWAYVITIIIFGGITILLAPR